MPALGHDVDVEALLTENHIRPHIKFTTLENPATLAMIQNGLGVSIMNELCTTGWTRKLVKLPLEPEKNLTFGIAVPSVRHASPASRRFLEYAVRMLTRPERRK